MDLTTRYLGLALAHPFMSGASPLGGDLDMVLRLEDAGAAAIVLPSLFEEDIVAHDLARDRYLEHLHRVKQRVHVPTIASLNGTAPEGWLQYARFIEDSGADAIELNFYHVPADPTEAAAAVERRVIDIVAVLKESITIPLAVKLSSSYSSLPHLAAQLDCIGADGLVLFNRFYEPDFDPELREPVLHLTLSDSSELPLRLRWLAILSSTVKASLAVTGGVHEPLDAVKAVMAGADGVQIVSALIQHGPARLTLIRREFEQWAEAHGYESLRDMRGCMNLVRCQTPEQFGRGNYVQALQSRAMNLSLHGRGPVGSAK
jgi:dihydroorotate dehydrogenase (fumarate)